MDLSLLVEYIEGKWSDEEFRWILESDSSLCEKVQSIYAKAIGADDYNVITRIFELNLLSVNDKKLLESIVERILRYEKIAYKKRKNPVSALTVADVILPYLENDILAEKFIAENILNAMPRNMTRTQQKKYCQSEQKRLFAYKKYPPQWLQNGEWPYDANGKPLIFIESHEQDATSEIFIFYNPDNDDLVKILQYN